MPVNVQRQEAGWSQDKQRSLAVFFDQHRNDRYGHPFGRAWWGYVENPADPGGPRRPVGELLPVSVDTTVDGLFIKGWEAPWLPEPKYIAHATSWMAGNRFRLNYAQMQAEYRSANETYYTRAAAESAARGWSHEVQLYGPLTFQLLAIVGNPPKSPKIPEAAAAEDPWLLGFTKEPNERLLKIILREKNMFTGMTYEEAGLDEKGLDPNAAETVSRVQQPAANALAALQAAVRPIETSQVANLSAILTEDEILSAVRAAETLKKQKEAGRKGAEAARAKRERDALRQPVGTEA